MKASVIACYGSWLKYLKKNKKRTKLNKNKFFHLGKQAVNKQKMLIFIFESVL